MGLLQSFEGLKSKKWDSPQGEGIQSSNLRLQNWLLGEFPDYQPTLPFPSHVSQLLKNKSVFFLKNSNTTLVRIIYFPLPRCNLSLLV